MRHNVACRRWPAAPSILPKTGLVNIILYVKGQLISKANCQAEDSSKKRTNEFVFTSMRRVFVRFLEESSARKKNVSRLSDL